MNLPYLVRLLCLCLASFFLVHLTLGLLASLAAPSAIRAACRMEARLAARFLLALRLAPAGLASLLVAGICAPSYLWLEPDASAEQVGWVCLAAAFLGLSILVASVARALRTCAGSARWVRELERGGAGPLVALTGILRHRLVISPLVMRALSADQLAAVVRHERAHRMSHDNLKRLLMLLAPGLLPFSRGFGALERAWAAAAEWAADDRATEGNGLLALVLASALVRVARLGTAGATPLLTTSLLADSADLAVRVDRLLHPVPRREAPGSPSPILKFAASITVAAGLASVMLQPATLYSAHELLEELIR